MSIHTHMQRAEVQYLRAEALRAVHSGGLFELCPQCGEWGGLDCGELSHSVYEELPPTYEAYLCAEALCGALRATV